VIAQLMMILFAMVRFSLPPSTGAPAFLPVRRTTRQEARGLTPCAF
jgi:hypothetical protein